MAEVLLYGSFLLGLSGVPWSSFFFLFIWLFIRHCDLGGIG